MRKQQQSLIQLVRQMEALEDAELFEFYTQTSIATLIGLKKAIEFSRCE